MKRVFKATFFETGRNGWEIAHPIEVRGISTGQKFNFTVNEAERLAKALLEEVAKARKAGR